MSDRKYSLIVYGATGFTGKQASIYFASLKGFHGKWAIAGRNKKKLEILQSEIKERFAGENVPYVVADTNDPKSLDQMTASTKVLVNMAGPFSLFGEPIVASCVANDTDYVDITGEAPYVRKLIDLHHEEARKKGVRIIPCCGFDSMPSDLGTLYLIDSMHKESGATCKSIHGYFRLKGEINKGSLATAFHLGEQKDNSPGARNPYYLNPEPKYAGRENDQKGPRYDANVRQWTAPFIMAGINTRVVRRSYALLGLDVRYNESFLVNKNFSFLKALYHAAILRTFLLLSRYRWFQKAIQKNAKNPTDAQMDEGYFCLKLIGVSEDNKQMQVTFSSSGDPGNRCTIKMICESALHLLETERDQLPGGSSYGGVLTPATGLGLDMLNRLQKVGFIIY